MRTMFASSASVWNAGQPHPLWNLDTEVNRTRPQHTHRYVPFLDSFSKAPVYGRSVPASRVTW